MLGLMFYIQNMKNYKVVILTKSMDIKLIFKITFSLEILIVNSSRHNNYKLNLNYETLFSLNN